MAKPKIHKIKIYGAWLFLVPKGFKERLVRGEVEEIPEKGWRLITWQPGKFETIDEVRWILPPDVAGNYVLAIGKGTTVEWEFFEQ